MGLEMSGIAPIKSVILMILWNNLYKIISNPAYLEFEFKKVET